VYFFGNIGFQLGIELVVFVQDGEVVNIVYKSEMFSTHKKFLQYSMERTQYTSI
jgi:hypothetical protein